MKNISQSAIDEISNVSNANPNVIPQFVPESLMQPENVTGAGGTLMTWLLQEARTHGHSLTDLADYLSVDAKYLVALQQGVEKTSSISDEFAVASARYLGVQTILTKLASGRVKACDFIIPSSDKKQSMAAALRKIQSDPIFGALLPHEAFSAPEAIQHFIVACYQEASGQEVWPYRSLPTSLQFLQRAALVQEEREQRNGMVQAYRKR